MPSNGENKILYPNSWKRPNATASASKRRIASDDVRSSANTSNKLANVDSDNATNVDTDKVANVDSDNATNVDTDKVANVDSENTAAESRKSDFAPIGAGDGSTKGDVMSDQLIDAKIARATAETETKIARFEGKLDLVLSKLSDLKEDNRSLKYSIWAAVIGTIAIVATMIGFLPVWLDRGEKNRDMITREVEMQLKRIFPPSVKEQQ